VLKLARSPVAKIDAIGVSVIGEHEDICNARITFANGCVANVTASRLALKTERKLRVFSSDAYVSVDYQKRYGVVVRRTGNLDTVRDTAEKIRRGDVTRPVWPQLRRPGPRRRASDQRHPSRSARQLESFVAAVRNGTTPEVTVEDGLAAVETAVWIVGRDCPAAL